MKTKKAKIMKMIFFAFLAALINACNCSAFAAGLIGNIAWREGHFDFKISQKDLSGQVIYAKIGRVVAVNSLFSATDGMCNENPSLTGEKRLFDVQPGATFNQCQDYIKDKYYYFYSPVGKKWSENYYVLIDGEKKYEADAIVKIQMGNVQTREPPKVLQVIKKNESEWDDSCNANGEYNGVTCEGWSYKSLMPLWGTAYQ